MDLPTPPLDPEVPADDAVAPDGEDGADGTRPKPTLEDVFGGRRGVLDSTAPLTSFIVTNLIAGPRAASVVAVAVAASLLLLRVVRKQPVRHAIGGFVGIVIGAVLASKTQSSCAFYWPPLATNTGYGLLFAGSVAVRKPLVGLILAQFGDHPPQWHQHPAVRRACSEVTLIWAALFLVRVAIQVPLLLAEACTAVGIVKLVLGPPAYIAVLAGTLPYVARRTRGVDLSVAPENRAD